MATQIFPIRDRIKWVDTTAGPAAGVGRLTRGGPTPSFTAAFELPPAVPPACPDIAAVLEPFVFTDFGGLILVAVVFATVTPAFIPAIAAY
jgi:hypothetical protein